MRADTPTTQKTTSRKLLQFSLLIFVVTWILYIAKRLFSGIHQLGDPDRYKENFAYFLENGFYEASVYGTSLLYNVAILPFYKLFGNVDTAIILVNVIAEILLLIIGLKLLQQLRGTVDRLYFYTIAAAYVFITLNIHSYVRTANDTFMAVFIGLVFYILFVKLKNTQKPLKYYVFLGILLGICTAIRPTSLFLFVIVAIFFAIQYILEKRQLKALFIAGFFIGIASLVTIAALHFPSIKEKGTLSFYNKNFEKDVNWVQRNYLGLKKIQEGKEPLHKSAIFNKTPFSEVRNYIAENGDNSLPSSASEFIQKDPKLYAQVVGYNFIYSTAKFFRYYGFLLLLPLLLIVKKSRYTTAKTSIWLFISYTILICMLCFTMMEYRWYIGYEILGCIAIITSVPFLLEKWKPKTMDIIFSVSLLVVAVCNVAQTFVISSTY